MCHGAPSLLPFMAPVFLPVTEPREADLTRASRHSGLLLQLRCPLPLAWPHNAQPAAPPVSSPHRPLAAFRQRICPSVTRADSAPTQLRAGVSQVSLEAQLAGTCFAVFFGLNPEIFLSSKPSKQNHPFPVFCTQLSLCHSGAQMSPVALHCLPKLRNHKTGRLLWDMEGQALGEVLYATRSQFPPKAAPLRSAVYGRPHGK